jgi:pimeloyl-ACP methyl ester carboxylesterase
MSRVTDDGSQKFFSKAIQNISMKSQQRTYLLSTKVYGDTDKPQVVLLHGIATSSIIWQDTIRLLSQDYQVVTIDLLGHGKSPKPDDVAYTTELHADSIAHTLQARTLNTKSVFVGFSIGALITAKLAAKYPDLASSAMLIAPPVYATRTADSLGVIDTAYRRAYTYIERLPKAQSLKTIEKVQQNMPRLIGKNVFNEHTWHPIMSSLRHTVQNQSIHTDIVNIDPKIPITILYGSLDHLVIRKRVEQLARLNPTTNIKRVLAPHGITQNYSQSISKLLFNTTATQPI